MALITEPVNKQPIPPNHHSERRVFRILALVYTPTLAIVAWLALVAISQGKEVALVRQAQTKDAASIAKLFDSVQDRYRRGEAMRDLRSMTTMREKIETSVHEHSNKDWHDKAGEMLIEMRGDIRRLQRDIEELEKEAHIVSSTIQE